MEESDRTILARGLGWMIGWRFDGKRGSFDLWRGMVVIVLLFFLIEGYVVYGRVNETQISSERNSQILMSVTNQIAEVRADIGQLRRAMMLPPRQRLAIQPDGVSTTNSYAVSEQ